MPTVMKGLRAAGRIIVGLFFLFAGLAKIADVETYSAMMDAAGLKPTAILLPATIALEVAGGALVIIGRKFAQEAALLLAIFTLTANIFLHAFWASPEELRVIQTSLFTKNIAIMGALFYIAATVRTGSPGTSDNAD